MHHEINQQTRLHLHQQPPHQHRRQQSGRQTSRRVEGGSRRLQRGGGKQRLEGDVAAVEAVVTGDLGDVFGLRELDIHALVISALAKFQSVAEPDIRCTMQPHASRFRSPGWWRGRPL